MEEKSDQANQVIYNALIIALILGLGIGFFFLKVTEQPTPSFSEIYFSNHTGLPERVQPGLPYGFDVTVRSHETATTDYSYVSKIELFNVYDTSEGFLDCTRDDRPKIYSKWHDVNGTNHTVFDVTGVDDPMYADMFTTLDTEFTPYRVKGDHRLTFMLASFFGNGSVSIVFSDTTGSDEGLRYRIVLSERNGTAYLYDSGSFRGKSPINITTRSENPVYLDLKDGKLNLTINEETVFYEDMTNYSDGMFWFETTGGYYKVTRPLVYSNAGKVELRFEEAPINDGIGRLTALKRDTIEFKLKGETERIRYNLSLNYFINLSPTLGTSGLGMIDVKAMPFRDNKGLYPMIYKWAGIEYPLTEFPSYVYESEEFNLTREKIDFGRYNITYKFQSGFGQEQFAMYFYDYYNNTRYQFLVSQKHDTLFFLRFRNDSLEITKKRFPLEQKPHSALMHFDGDRLDIFIDNHHAMEIKDIDSNFSDISIESKNSYTLVSNLEIRRDDPACSTRTEYHKCFKTYRLQGERPISVYQDIKIVPQPELDLTNLTFNENETTKSPRVSLKQLFPKEVKEVVEKQENKFIEDRNIVLDGPAAVISGMENYTFEFNFQNLDGLKIVYAGLMDFNYTDMLKIVMLEKEDKIYVLTPGKNLSYDYEIPPGMHLFRFKYEGNSVSLMLDEYSKPFVVIPDFNASRGYFYVGTEGTYANINELRIADKELETVRRFGIDENPCRMRPIYKEVFTDESFTLSPGEDRKYRYNFTVPMEFDYGLVTSTIESKNESIHFWIKR